MAVIGIIVFLLFAFLVAKFWPIILVLLFVGAVSRIQKREEEERVWFQNAVEKRRADSLRTSAKLQAMIDSMDQRTAATRSTEESRIRVLGAMNNTAREVELSEAEAKRRGWRNLASLEGSLSEEERRRHRDAFGTARDDINRA